MKHKRKPLYVLIPMLLMALALTVSAAEIKHRFVATDESGNQLLYVDQTNPQNDWTIPLPGNRDIQILKEGTVLATVPTGYHEYDLKNGKRIKEVDAGKGILSLVRLPNGHTLLASPNQVIELDKNDKQVKDFPIQAGGSLRLLRLAKNGNILYTSSGTSVKEVRPNAEPVRELDLTQFDPQCNKPYFLEELANGQFLTTTGYGGTLLLLDKDWKQVKSFGGKGKIDGTLVNFFADAQRLSNSNIVVANWTGHNRKDSKKGPQAIEFDKDGKVVWTWHDPERAGCLHGIEIIEETKVTMPRVLIIGDSISLGYTPLVAKMLQEEAVVMHSKGGREIGANAGATDRGIKYLEKYLGDEKWDVIHFNWGLWDLCYRHPDAKAYGHRDKVNGTISIPLDQYEKNLKAIVTRLKKTGAKLIWASTTKVPEGEAGRIVGDEIKYNRVAASIMKQHGIATNDLYALTRSFNKTLSVATGDVHYKPEGSQKLAQQVAESIRTAIEIKNQFQWKSEVPEDCPFEPSETLDGIFFTGRHSDYQCGDTFYPSWASDGHLYSPWTDGTTDGVRCSSGGNMKNGYRTGHAVMTGEDPVNLTIKNTSPPKRGYAAPYRGRYPCGSLVHNGIWYYGTYCLGPSASYTHSGFRWNWPNLGPMPGFQISKDLGKTWTDSPLSATNPLFPEPAKFMDPVKMGAPHFVDFGKNMEHSPDGKAYLLGMGAEVDDPNPRPCITAGEHGTVYKINEVCKDRVHLGMRPGEAKSELKGVYENAFKEVKGQPFAHGNLSWVTADQVYLSRVKPSPQTINDPKAYEFFAGHDPQGEPVWTSNFAKIKPLIEWNNNMGCVTATYVPGLKKYLMCVTDGWPTVAKMNSYILEADKITGPWRMVTYMKDFGQQGYFLNFPSKFVSDDGKTLWLCYSANFSDGWNGVKLDFNPRGGRYGLSLHEIRLQMK